MVKREKANYMIQSVSHALDVLEELAGSGGEVGVTELSKRLKLHKNNVFRLLATLELRGFVEQNKETEDYRLGANVLRLAQAYLTQSNLVQKATPILRNLVEATGETASIATLQNGQVQYPVSIPSKRPVKVTPRIAMSFEAKKCAAGRLLTAQLSDAVLAEILAANTPQDAAIKSQLNELRTKGQIVDRAAIEADVVCIAHVVRGVNNEVLGAIEVLAPQYRAKAEEIIPYVEEAASSLSSSFGAARTGIVDGIQKEVVTSTNADMGVRIK